MTEQRECEGHRERRIPNVFLSFLIFNMQKFQIFEVCYITLTSSDGLTYIKVSRY